MRAVTFQAAGEVRVEERREPEPADAPAASGLYDRRAAPKIFLETT